MNGDTPTTPVNWDDPTTQWQLVLSDSGADTNSGNWGYRFTGVAVGSQGSLFVADDKTGNVYRIRPTGL
jgi:glucose/arabinose dehydrogenase